MCSSLQLEEPPDIFLGDNRRIWREIHDMKAVNYNSAHGRTYAKSFTYEFGNGLFYRYFTIDREFLKCRHQIIIQFDCHFHGELSLLPELLS